MFYEATAYYNHAWTSYNLEHPLNNQILLHAGNELLVEVPEKSLASGSLQIQSITERLTISEWTPTMHREAFDLMQKIASIWKQKGITDYLIYGKEAAGKSFCFEMVPYEKSAFSIFRQLKVLFGITFGAFADSMEKREAVAREYEGVRDLFSEALADLSDRVDSLSSHDDAFCKESTFARQCVFEGRTISVLQDYAPLATEEEKLHLILVTRQHRDSFSDISEEEYLESAGMMSKLISHYREKGFSTTYIFEKIGRPAGQSVPHRHLHLVFTKQESEELLGKLLVLKKMVLGASKMPDEELRRRVESLRAELLGVLQ
ncbi:HIT family protein [Estrella lausannensis]|uniref:HIT domain-containing protein n=1 Tax=Estrella lausannensis TaxID=483423 RepID=A0A0H5DTA6_9BACT|nr:HIT domain-containing protein [Estrella lausannensis]CRX39064.1 hypothetical protein ELAC_1737 [Estrella lausannensis]